MIRNKFIILLTMSLFFTNCKQHQTTSLGSHYFKTFENNREMYLDLPDSSRFDAWEKDVHSKYKKYKINHSKLKNINLENVTIKIICAAWCSDTREQVSSFIKIMETLDIPKESIKYHFVNREKKAPGDTFVEKYTFTKVPTFVFFRGALEIGSIIETPAETLEKDLLWILGKKKQ